VGKPKVRLVIDAHGGVIERPVEMDLSAPLAGRAAPEIARVVSTDGWKAASEQDAAQVLVDEDDEEDQPAQLAQEQLPTGSAARDNAPAPQPTARLLYHSDSSPSQVSIVSTTGESPSYPSSSMNVSLGWGTNRVPSVRVVAPPPVTPAPPPPEDRTVMQASPFEVEQEQESEDHEEGRTVFYQHETPVAAPAPTPVATARGALGSTPLVHVLVYVLDRELSGSLVLQDRRGSAMS